MAEQVGFQQQFKVVAPDGTISYAGTGKVFNAIEFTSGMTFSTFANNEAVRISTTGGSGNTASVESTVFPASAFAAAQQATLPPVIEEVYGARVISATDTGFFGVLISGPLAPGKKGLAAGVGSMVPCVCVNPPASNVLNARVIGSATLGSVTSAGTTTVGYQLGVIIKKAGTTGGTTDTGSATQVGCMVLPY